MPRADMKITVELDPIVKLQCLNIACKHNTHYVSGLYCNLKNVMIDEDGQCLDVVLKGNAKG